ncbi:hypothetical protein THRCLA_22284 [Thraustotheca clavata]|uniref:Secreted protein n=1 Tax=Thraustotheca clavata TaxID=74557 RepID=A0A1V9Z6X4_9STRA|nr:hypothetical protein THRCLA_22284 [Thraustotheca clavata]
MQVKLNVLLIIGLKTLVLALAFEDQVVLLEVLNIRAIENYSAICITKLYLQEISSNFSFAIGFKNGEKQSLTLLNGAFTNSALTYLWIENVNLTLQEKVYPPQLQSLKDKFAQHFKRNLNFVIA